MRTSVRPLHLALSSLLWLTLASATLAQAPRPVTADRAPAQPPVADALYLEKTDQAPELGNVRVLAELGNPAIERLLATQGHADHFVFQGLELRDDGQGADGVAFDGLYSAIVGVELDDLLLKTEVDRQAIDRGGRVPFFRGREKLGSLPGSVRGAFDFRAFQAGERVALERSAWVLPDAGTDLAAKFVPGTNGFQEHVLMIRDPAVVTNPARTFDPCTGFGTPMGAWTFGHLMAEMSNTPVTGVPANVFVDDWMREWLIPHVINTFPVPQRPALGAILGDWRLHSGMGGPLDLRISPFRLLSIVLRTDLREPASTAIPMWANGGELRFVFGMVIPGSWASSASFPGPIIPGTVGCRALEFSVILEYEVPLQTCVAVRNWANNWVGLDAMWGTPPYLPTLQGLTASVTARNAVPSKPNGSALGQTRTNEIALAGPWELREFHIDAATNRLVSTTTADAPHDSFNFTPMFTNYATSGLTSVPLIFGGVPFLGANPQAPSPFFFWDGPGLVSGGFITERHEASLATCNGCHTGETATPFVHVDPATPLPPAGLSGFLTGITVTDPAAGAPARDFDALEDREADLVALATSACFTSGGGISKSLDGTSRGGGIALEELLREPVREVH